MKRVEFCYDISCPYAYLASTQIEALCAKAGAELVWKPVLLGGIYRSIGAPDSPPMPAARARLNVLDMHRWADVRGVPFTMPPSHPARTVLALRAMLAAGEASFPAASKALYRAYWAEGRDVTDPAVVRDALTSAGLDGAALVARADDASIKDELRARTDEAVRRGAFGVPTFFVSSSERNGGAPELVWGQDRLSFVAEMLGIEPAPLAPAEPETEGREVSFFFDFSSPYAYLASTQIEAVARRAGATVRYRPFLLGALFKMVGTADIPLFTMPAPKREHLGVDLARWSAHYRVPFAFPAGFPINSVKALRVVLQVPDSGKAAIVKALFDAAWAEGKDITKDADLIAIANDTGFDGAALVAGTSSDAVKDQLRVATSEAQGAGLFGAPSFLVNGLLFWGQDRLELVEKALRGWRPAASEGPPEK